MRRFLLHVLPGGFHRIRHFGMLANNARKEKVALARELLNVVPTAMTTATTIEATLDDVQADQVQPNLVCRHCGGLMILIETFVRGQSIRAPPMVRGVA
jgi:hypothetical protein